MSLQTGISAKKIETYIKKAMKTELLKDLPFGRKFRKIGDNVIYEKLHSVTSESMVYCSHKDGYLEKLWSGCKVVRVHLGST